MTFSYVPRDLVQWERITFRAGFYEVCVFLYPECDTFLNHCTT